MKHGYKALLACVLTVLLVMSSTLSVFAAGAEAPVPEASQGAGEETGLPQEETALPAEEAPQPPAEEAPAPEDDPDREEDVGTTEEEEPPAKAEPLAQPNAAGWYSAPFELEIAIRDIAQLLKLEAVVGEETTVLYDAEDLEEDEALPIELFLFGVGTEGQADPEAPGQYKVMLRYTWVGEEVPQEEEATYSIDAVAPETPAVNETEGVGAAGEEEPPFTLQLTTQSGPSGHVFWMSADGITFQALEGDTAVLTQAGTYSFKAVSGAGLESPVTTYDYTPDDDPVPPLEGWQESTGRWAYYKAGVALAGWQTIEGKAYYFGADTFTLTGKAVLEGNTYYFMPTDKGARTSGFVDLTGERYFFAEQTGVMQKGFFSHQNVLYYAAEKNGVLHMSGWLTLGSKKYYAQNAGQLVVGHKKVSGKYYFFHRDTGAMRTGLIKDGTDRYYGDKKTGVLEKGLKKVSGKKYYFAGNGKAQQGVRKIKGKYYYFNKNTKEMKLKGWAKDGKKWYYASKKDSTLLTGAQKIGSKYYYFNKTGQALSGKRKVAGAYTFYDRTNFARVKGFVTDKGKIYYIDKKSGDMLFGWQKIGKYEYHFDKKGVAAVGKKKIGGVTYEFDEKGRLISGSKAVAGSGHGIDVSAHQGRIDWKAVAASGKVDFAIIRGLSWSNAVGYYIIDPTFDYNVREAKKNGIRVGVYLFSYAFNSAEMLEEVNFFANHPIVKAHKKEGYVYDMPVYIDYEYDQIPVRNPSYEGRTEALRAGLKRLKALGYTPGFYSSHDWAVRIYNAPALQQEGYDFWYARFYDNKPNKAAGAHGWTGPQLAMWQYSSKGSIAGVQTRVDVNHSYKTYKFKKPPS